MVGRLKKILGSVGAGVRLKNSLVLKVRFIFSFFVFKISNCRVSNSQSRAFLKTSAEEFISTFLGNVLL